MLKSPEVLAGAVTLMVGLIGLSFRGAKAKLTDEIVTVIDRRFEETAKLKLAQDETVALAIGGLRSDVDDLKASVSEVRTDVREVARDLKTIMSNGHFKHE